MKNWYPLELIPEILDPMREACTFTKLDLLVAHNLI